MIQHAPEPWYVTDRVCILRADGEGPFGGFVAVTEPETVTTPEQDAATARRIVACVNALAGVKDPAGTLGEVRHVIAGLLRLVPDSPADTMPSCWPDQARALLVKLGKG